MRKHFYVVFISMTSTVCNIHIFFLYILDSKTVFFCNSLINKFWSFIFLAIIIMMV